MRSNFMAAMRRAATATRAQSPLEATRVIREALSGGREASAETPTQQAPRRRPPRLDPDAEIVEPTAYPEFRLRKPLRDVLRTLRDGRGAIGLRGFAEAPAAAPTPPDGARFEARGFACVAGARSYKLYVPASGTPLRGLVLMLHGCKQNPDDFATGTGMNDRAEFEGLLVAYPAQTTAENAMACWNWFRPGDQHRHAGEPAILAGLAQALVKEFGIDPGQVFVAGLSAGGAMAAVLGETYPDVFAAVGVHSGLPAGAANDVLSAFAAMRGDPGMTRTPMARPGPRTIVFHGSADGTVNAVNAERIVAAAVSHSVQVEEGRKPGGRVYTRSVHRDADGMARAELWLVDGAGHAWSGGKTPGSFTDPAGPDASAAMLRFFLNPS